MGAICKYCNECKNQRLLWDLYAGITMNEKPTTIMGPICEYCNEWKKQRLLWDLYASIAYLKMALWNL
jgi:hypothetical protein